MEEHVNASVYYYMYQFFRVEAPQNWWKGVVECRYDYIRTWVFGMTSGHSKCEYVREGEKQAVGKGSINKGSCSFMWVEIRKNVKVDVSMSACEGVIVQGELDDFVFNSCI